MKRREFTLALLTTACFATVDAGAKDAARIGVLGSGSESSPLSINQMTWLRSGLRASGLIEAQDFVFDAKWANGEYHRFPPLAAELIASRANVIVVSTIAAAEAARDLSRIVPVVMTGLNDPAAAKLVNTLSRPGGNITGMATLNEVVIFKLLELIPTILPNAKRIAVMLNPTNPSNPVLLGPISLQISQLGLQMTAVEVATPANLETAFQKI